jgi:hypothetical protein
MCPWSPEIVTVMAKDRRYHVHECASAVDISGPPTQVHSTSVGVGILHARARE